jgi:hypothetical protein
MRIQALGVRDDLCRVDLAFVEAARSLGANDSRIAFLTTLGFNLLGDTLDPRSAQR